MRSLESGINDHFLNYFPPKPALKSISDPSSTHSQSKRNRPSQTSTQHRQYWPKSFKPSNKPLDNIPMGTMVHGFDGLQQCRLPDSDHHYTVQKLAEVSMSKAWPS
jgi:hypothetical protein